MENKPEQPTTVIDTDEYEVIPLPPEPEVDPSKGGPKPKKLVAVEVYGFEVGRGKRKRVVIPDDVYKLAAMGCTNLEIAKWFDIDRDSLKWNFQDVLDKGREDMKMRLRQAMWKNAWGGNAALQIFLAKNYLDMSDNGPKNSAAAQPLPWQD